MRFVITSLLVTGLVVATGCEGKAPALRVATPSNPVDVEIAANLVDMLDESDTARLSLSATSMADTEALDALTSGSIDLALVSNAMPYREGVETVIPLYPTVLHVAYREGRDASSGAALLSGARVFAGVEGSASRRMFERVVGRMQRDGSGFEYVTDLDTQADVVILFAPISPERIDEYPGLRLYSFGDPDSTGRGGVVDAATLLNPHLRPFVIPTGTYGAATPEPVLTLAVDKLLVARADVDPSIIYDLVQAILRLRPALAARHPGHFEHLADDFDVTRSTFVVHAGTQAYLQREAPTIYERYSGVAEVVVTLFVALASATIAGVRILQRRRKNRIDEFYSRAIKIRNEIAADATAAQRQAAVARVRALQNAAFEQLVDEKLAADDSFRIFITLSDDILWQLGANSGPRRSGA